MSKYTGEDPWYDFITGRENIEDYIEDLERIKKLEDALLDLQEFFSEIV